MATNSGALAWKRHSCDERAVHSGRISRKGASKYLSFELMGRLFNVMSQILIIRRFCLIYEESVNNDEATK
jgi:hypothetical protein